ncbi:hypothetical protein ARMGADRAFT_92092 [Armillaria gallica]|uniref:Protein O-mannosyl-transferase C-terminal four TM domain-containing protein n=1 Tax=Armillaria gallica TaxID=47427 RepID=A0A2H3DGZ0_ARMGA|nr:hypothetical protein ARMGADRAFT_92092 [Armillaria gallica]
MDETVKTRVSKLTGKFTDCKDGSLPQRSTSFALKSPFEPTAFFYAMKTDLCWIFVVGARNFWRRCATLRQSSRRNCNHTMVLRLQIAAVLIIISVWVFLHLSPLAYGNTWTKDECKSSKWLKTWDFSCNDFLKTDRCIHTHVYSFLL